MTDNSGWAFAIDNRSTVFLSHIQASDVPGWMGSETGGFVLGWEFLFVIPFSSC